jgi:hypothetical protein
MTRRDLLAGVIVYSQVGSLSVPGSGSRLRASTLAEPWFHGGLVGVMRGAIGRVVAARVWTPLASMADSSLEELARKTLQASYGGDLACASDLCQGVDRGEGFRVETYRSRGGRRVRLIVSPENGHFLERGRGRMSFYGTAGVVQLDPSGRWRLRDKAGVYRVWTGGAVG